MAWPIQTHYLLWLIVQGVSKLLGQASRMSYLHQNEGEKNSDKHTSGIEWVLSLIERLHSTINTLTV